MKPPQTLSLCHRHHHHCHGLWWQYRKPFVLECLAVRRNQSGQLSIVWKLHVFMFLQPTDNLLSRKLVTFEFDDDVICQAWYCQLENNVKVYLWEFVYLRRLHLFVFLSTSFGAWQLLDKWASWTKSRTITDQRCSSVYLLCGSNVLRIFLRVSKQLQNFVNNHWKCKEGDSGRYVKIVKIWYSLMFPDPIWKMVCNDISRCCSSVTEASVCLSSF